MYKHHISRNLKNSQCMRGITFSASSVFRIPRWSRSRKLEILKSKHKLAQAASLKIFSDILHKFTKIPYLELAAKKDNWLILSYREPSVVINIHWKLELIGCFLYFQWNLFKKNHLLNNATHILKNVDKLRSGFKRNWTISRKKAWEAWNTCSIFFQGA